MELIGQKEMDLTWNRSSWTGPPGGAGRSAALEHGEESMGHSRSAERERVGETLRRPTARLSGLYHL